MLQYSSTRAPQRVGAVLVPEDRYEALWLIAEDLDLDDIYRDLMAVRQKTTVGPDTGPAWQAFNCWGASAGWAPNGVVSSRRGVPGLDQPLRLIRSRQPIHREPGAGHRDQWSVLVGAGYGQGVAGQGGKGAVVEGAALVPLD